MWVKINSALTTATAYNFVSASGGGSANQWLVFGKAGAGDNLVCRGLFSGSGLTSVFRSSPAGHSTGQWYHFLATFDGTTFRPYIDGSALTPVTRSGESLAFTTGLNLTFGGNGTAFSPVSVDEVTIWDRAVDLSEVASANAPIDVTDASGLVRWYRMGDDYTPGSFVIRERVAGTYPLTWYGGSETTDFVDSPS